MKKWDNIGDWIAQIVTQFQHKYMGWEPKSVLVDLHESHILVTLRQVSSAAERACASDPPTRELVEKVISAAFDAVKLELEAEIAAIVGRRVRRSRISADPLTGDAIVSFVLDDIGSAQERHKKGPHVPEKRGGSTGW